MKGYNSRHHEYPSSRCRRLVYTFATVPVEPVNLKRPRNDPAAVVSDSPLLLNSVLLFPVATDCLATLQDIIMAGKPFCPSVALLRTLNRLSCPPQCLRQTTLRHQRPLHASRMLAKEPLSFHGQLYESTADRVKKERAEQARFAEARGESLRGRGAATSFLIVSTALLGYWAGSQKARPPAPESTLPLAATVKPHHNTGKANLQAAWSDFVDIVGDENVSTKEEDLQYHSGSDWSSYTTKADEKPFLIVFPSTTEEVSKIVKVCYGREIPITAYSGGTSLEGHFSATRGGICVDFRRMDKILKLHKDDLDVIVQPALGWELLNEELAKDGLFFPPDPGPGAQIGGMVGTGCSGTNAYRYGTMRDWVLSLTIVLADGTIIKTRQRPRKSSAGYDLTRTFIGSEGTLGLVTEATLKVTVKPKNESVAVASFATVREAAECVAEVVGEGIPIAAIEVLDDVQMRCINDSGSTSRDWKELPTLFFKFTGTALGVKEQIKQVQQLAKGKGSKSFDFAKNADEAAELWSARKEALWSVMAKRRDESDHVWTTDVAVPISRLPDIIEQTKEDMAKSGLLAAMVGHVGDGNFHAILLFNDKERTIAEDVVHRMVKRAVEMEGTVTGEHGVGLIKRDYLAHELGEETVDLMRKACPCSNHPLSFPPPIQDTVRLTDAIAQTSFRPSLYPELRQGRPRPETESRRSQGVVKYIGQKREPSNEMQPTSLWHHCREPTTVAATLWGK